MLNVNELTIGQAKEILELLGKSPSEKTEKHRFIGKKVIVRTYSAGVFFGELVEKEGEEIILKNARRLYRWHTNNGGISLSEVANHGLKSDASKVCESVPLHWCIAIEIMPCTKSAIQNIESQNDYKA